MGAYRLATTNYNLPTITGNMTADVVRDVNALAEATDTAIKSAVDGIDLTNIEQEISDVDSRVTAHLAESASLTQEGHVQLSNATNSESETLAATPKAVKLAMDKAMEAFTQVSNGKTEIATAITDVDNSLNPSGSDTFSQLANFIRSISTGKKYANGSISSSSITNGFLHRDGTVKNNYFVEVTGLDFIPSTIVLLLESPATSRQPFTISFPVNFFTSGLDRKSVV